MLNELSNYIKSLGSVAVAFSGGADSAFLLKIALNGSNRAAGIFVKSDLTAATEEEDAKKLAADMGARLITVDTDVFSIPGFARNDPNRCYICKKEIFSAVIKAAKDFGFDTVLDGSNKDDEGEDRPGRKALAELGVKSPLAELGFTKRMVRDCSRDMRLTSHNKPAYACLATRIPTGEIITKDKLVQIERCEAFLHSKGILDVRVRHIGPQAKIEVGENAFAAIFAMKKIIVNEFEKNGFTTTTLDLCPLIRR